MDDARLDAIEWLLARVIADMKTIDQLEGELDHDLPVAFAQWRPEEKPMLPHYERVLQISLDLKRANPSSV